MEERERNGQLKAYCSGCFKTLGTQYCGPGAENIHSRVVWKVSNITIYEIDHHVENAKITVEGEQLSYQELHDLIVETGGAVHSIDEVAAGKRTVEEVVTHQD